jgi:hypothetical protein
MRPVVNAVVMANWPQPLLFLSPFFHYPKWFGTESVPGVDESSPGVTKPQRVTIAVVPYSNSFLRLSITPATAACGYHSFLLEALMTR